MLKQAKDFLMLRHNAFRPRKAIERIQEERLRRMLRHAYSHSSWYRKRFTAAGITEEMLDSMPLSAFPVMDKTDLTAHFDEIVTDPSLTMEALRTFDTSENREEKVFAGKYHVVHSSGSTGKPSYFVYDEQAWNTMLLGIIRGALWDMTLPQIVNLLRRRVKILYVAATDGRYGGALAVGDGVEDMGLPQKFLDINRPITEWIDMLTDYRPDVVIGYPSAIRLLCDLAREHGIPFQPERIITCGEPLPNGLRIDLRNQTGAAVINFYGASESLSLGVAGPQDETMVLFDDLNMIEVVNEEMYLTCLYNFTQPLIRYRLTDRLTLREAQGAFSRAEVLLSRSEDILWFRDQNGKKEFLHPLAIEGFCLEGLTDYQFVKNDHSSFTMRAVAAENRQQEIMLSMQKQMYRILREKHLDWVEFRVQFVREIMPDAHSGKKKLIVCDPKGRPCVAA